MIPGPPPPPPAHVQRAAWRERLTKRVLPAVVSCMPTDTARSIADRAVSIADAVMRALTDARDTDRNSRRE